MMGTRLFLACILAALLIVSAGCGDDHSDIPCPSDQTLCEYFGSYVCVDLLTDDDHCGECDNQCGLHADCIDGECTCVTGYTACSGQCVNLNFDAANCGICGNLCAAGEVCVNGQCAFDCACEGGMSCCGTDCVDTETDEAHCGACDNACRADQVCDHGTCECTGSLEDCDGECVDTRTDNAHCGNCLTSCGAWGVCRDGICEPALPCECNYDCGLRDDGLVCSQSISFCEPGSPPADCQDSCGCYVGEVCRYGKCVEMAPECTTDGDCEQGQVCSNGWCINVPCQSREDCMPPDCVCHNGECAVPPPVCQGNQDCCWGYLCSFGTCVPESPVCQSDDDCLALNPERPRCLEGECVPECFIDIDCHIGEVCINGHCLSPSCTVESCPLGQWCDLSDGQCKPGCDEDADCTAPDTCNLVTHQCGQTDCCSGCADGGWCDTLTCQCVDNCNSDADCPAGFECQADFRCWCTVASCPAGATCNPQTGACDLDPMPCQTDNDCASGWTCNQASQQCEALGTAEEGDLCYRDNNCDDSAGLLCDNGLFCIGCAIADPDFSSEFACYYECSLMIPNCPNGTECLYRHTGLKGLCMPI